MQRKALPKPTTFEIGDPVIVYQRSRGQVLEETMFEARVMGITRLAYVIRHPEHGMPWADQVSWFDKETRQCLRAAPYPTVYFAGMDEDFL